MVQPLHLQDNLSKIPLLQKLHESARIAPELEKEQFAKQLMEQQADRMEQTQDTQESEKVRERQQKEKEKEKKRKRQILKLSEKEIEEARKEADEDDQKAGRIVDIVV